tara:strand:- start:245 stop:553 length:309 start_codon:yes stop_codon:yes gene_type:complete
MLMQEECNEVAKPDWWNDEALKALSARVMRAVATVARAHAMRAIVLSAISDGTWRVGPRSAAELMEAAAHFERAGALSNSPAAKAGYASFADACRRFVVAEM